VITFSSAIALMILVAPWLLFAVIVIGALWQAYRRHSHHVNNQKGVVLILSLLIMTILLIMGVTFLQIALRVSQYVRLSLSMCVSLCICMSLSLCVCLSVHVSMCPCVWLSVFVSL